MFWDGAGDYDGDIGGFDTGSYEDVDIPPQVQPEKRFEGGDVVAAAFGMEEMAAVLEDIVAQAEEDRAVLAEAEEEIKWDQARVWEEEEAAAADNPEDLVIQAVEDERMEELEGFIADNGTFYSYLHKFTLYGPF